MVEPHEDSSTGSKIAAFVVTLIAIPFLFVATCVPVGFIGMASGTPVIVFGIYGVSLVGFGIYKAVRTNNPGIRWGIIAALLAAAIYAAVTFLPLH